MDTGFCELESCGMSFDEAEVPSCSKLPLEVESAQERLGVRPLSAGGAKFGCRYNQSLQLT